MGSIAIRWWHDEQGRRRRKVIRSSRRWRGSSLLWTGGELRGRAG